MAHFSNNSKLHGNIYNMHKLYGVFQQLVPNAGFMFVRKEFATISFLPTMLIAAVMTATLSPSTFLFLPTKRP